MTDGNIIIGTEINTKNFDKEIAVLEDKLKDVVATLKMADEDKTLFSTSEIKEMESEAQKLGRKIDNLRKKQEQLDKTKLNNMKQSLQNIGGSIEGLTKKVVRWGLAIFGIRSAFRFVRMAMSELSSRNEQLATDIEYIRFALASTLAPVIEKIVQLAYKLMFYIGYIAKAWFGVNIFANATKKAFQGGTKALKDSNKQAKQLEKTLAGFDEMNVLQDNKNDSSSADTGIGGATPSFDLSKIQGDVPKWLEWIGKHGKEIIAILAGITAGLIALKFGASGLMALGIGLMVAGLVYAVKSLLDYLKKPTWENFGKIIQGIGVFVIGLGVAFLGLPGIIAGVVILILGTIIKYWDEIKAFLQKGIDWLTSKSDWVHEHLGGIIGNIYDFLVSTIQGTVNFLDVTFKSIKGIFDGLIKFIKGVFTGNWKLAWQGVKQIFANIWNWISKTATIALTGLINKARAIASTVGKVVSSVFKTIVNAILIKIESVMNAPIRTVNTLIGLVNKIPGVNIGKLPTFDLPRLAKGGIVNLPGRGVPIGGAIAGEKSMEGVIPLTDSQQMSLLGEAIGKHVNINATIPVYAYNRQVDRQIRRIKAEDNFAYNR